MSKTHDFFRSFFSFFIKVAIIHTVTYIVFGIVFSQIFDYSTVYSLPKVATFMQSFDSPWTLAGPFLQPIRALVFTIVLYPFRERIKNSKLGWLMLWGLFLGIGIIATPSAAPGSIEGLIYTQLPISFQMIGLPEIILQTLTFSFFLWVVEALPFKQKDFYMKPFFSKIIRSIIIAAIGILLTAISGIMLSNLLNVDIKNAKIDKFVVAYLTTITLLSTITSYILGYKAYIKPAWHLLLVPLYLIIYVGFPYGYNYIFNTPYNSIISLIPLSCSAIIICIASFFIFGGVKKKEIDIENAEKEDKNGKDNNLKIEPENETKIEHEKDIENKNEKNIKNDNDNE